MNPVARRELQERFRTLRSPILLSIWVLAAGVLTMLAYLVAQAGAEDRLDGAGLGVVSSIFASASMGRFILHTLLIGLLTAVVFVAPGQAAVSIVGERERQTLPLLQVSQLSAWGIVVGKLGSSLAYILLLLVATTPLLVIPVLLGGVTIWNVLAGVFMVTTAAILIGSVSIWVSARAKSVQGAVLGSYVWTVALVFGSLALLVGEVYLVGPENLGPTRFESGVPRDDGRELYSAHINPYVGLVDASMNPIDFRDEILPSPYTPFRAVLVKRQGFATTEVLTTGGFPVVGLTEDVFFERGFSTFPVVQPSTSRVADASRRPVWPSTLVFELAVSLLALWAASRHIKVPRRRLRSPMRREPVAS